MGLSEGLRHSLESYLKKSAADLDERGAEITFRENEVEFEIKRLETLENELTERAARVEELRPQQQRADEALRRTLGTVEERALTLAEKAGELRERTTKIVEAEAELAERERLAAYRRDRLRSEQKLLPEREREPVEVGGGAGAGRGGGRLPERRDGDPGEPVDRAPREASGRQRDPHAGAKRRPHPARAGARVARGAHERRASGSTGRARAARARAQRARGAAGAKRARASCVRRPDPGRAAGPHARPAARLEPKAAPVMEGGRR